MYHLKDFNACFGAVSQPRVHSFSVLIVAVYQLSSRSCTEFGVDKKLSLGFQFLYVLNSLFSVIFLSC